MTRAARRLTSLAAIAAMVAACGGSDAPDGDTTAAAPAGTTVALRDTMPYESMIGGGQLALLHVNGAYVDSADLAFGAHVVGRDSVVFLPVEPFTAPSAERGAQVERHVLLHDGRRTVLPEILPFFDSYFSSPVVEGDALIWWGMKPAAGSGVYDLYAMRWDFSDARLDSLPLGRAGFATDARFHLPEPTVSAAGVEFRGDSATWLVAPGFARAERRGR